MSNLKMPNIRSSMNKRNKCNKKLKRREKNSKLRRLLSSKDLKLKKKIEERKRNFLKISEWSSTRKNLKLKNVERIVKKERREKGK